MINHTMTGWAMTKDPDEGDFILAIWGGRADAGLLQKYIALLEKHRDVRGEFLRLHCLLASQGIASTDQHDRYRKLLEQLAPTWDRTPVSWMRIIKLTARLLNCGKAAPQLPRIRFAYECPNAWEKLTPTETMGVRFCGECQRKVYYCDSAVSAETRALQGECVAVPRAVADPVFRQLSECVTGRPEVGQLWADKIFPADDIAKHR